MAPVRVMLGVIVSCLLLGLARAQACEKDIDFNGDVYFEKMTYFSDAVVAGQVTSIANGGEANIKLDCIYKTDGDENERMIQVSQSSCPASPLETGSKYLMFLEKTSGGYALRYTAFEADIISEAAAVCGIKRKSFVNDDEVCPAPEDSCIKYMLPTTAEPEPEATPKPEPETQKPGNVDVVVAGQDATPEPEDGTNAATTNFLSCALSCLSFVMSLLML